MDGDKKTQADTKDFPTVFVIFGATGDLAKKRTFPSLFELKKANLLPQNFKIIATGRTQYSTEQFRKYVQEILNSKEKELFSSFTDKIEYIVLDVAQDQNLEELKDKINAFEKSVDSCITQIFYMAISPDIFLPSIENLGKAGLHIGCQEHGSKPRIIIEKPFGQNLQSAKELSETISKYFSEEQIYRIDHYLGKETVQNIFAFRFGNEIFEPLLNNKYVDHVQITTSEAIGVEKRGVFYEKTGALRDILQNHMIQLMSLITMDQPEKFHSQSIRKEKLKIISNIKKLNETEIASHTVRGQYEGYTQEENVNQNSQTETYAFTKLFIENERWSGIPFYLRTGKKLTGKVTSIIVQFKERGHTLFENFQNHGIPNHLTIQIQPNEGIGLTLVAKKPGLINEFEQVNMEFCYKTSFNTVQPDAYERLLLDVINADQSLFISQEEIEESWKVIDPIENAWKENKVPLIKYKIGSWGPKEAEEIVKKDKRSFLQPILTICKI